MTSSEWMLTFKSRITASFKVKGEDKEGGIKMGGRRRGGVCRGVFVTCYQRSHSLQPHRILWSRRHRHACPKHDRVLQQRRVE